MESAINYCLRREHLHKQVIQVLLGPSLVAIWRALCGAVQMRVSCASIYLNAHLVWATSQLIDSLELIKLAMSSTTRFNMAIADHCIEAELSLWRAVCDDEFGAKLAAH